MFDFCEGVCYENEAFDPMQAGSFNADTVMIQAYFRRLDEAGEIYELWCFLKYRQASNNIIETEIMLQIKKCV
jgi:hypothetical protein